MFLVEIMQYFCIFLVMHLLRPTPLSFIALVKIMIMCAYIWLYHVTYEH